MSFTAVDLSKLPAPDIVEALDYEVILAARLDRLEALLKDPANPILPDWDKTLESDPHVILCQEAAYREMNLRQRVNDGARAVMLAFARGTNLDHLLANFETARLTLIPADPTAIPPVAEVKESDDSFVARGQMAFEALSTAGPEGAYVYHAKSADARVADVKITSPSPVQVVITVLASGGDGIASDELLAKVAAAMPAGRDDGVRPLTDQVLVQVGTKIAYAVDGTLELYDGPDQDLVLQAAAARLYDFAKAQRRLGEPVTIDGIHAATRVSGIRRITLAAPAASIEVGETGFAHCTAITLRTAARIATVDMDTGAVTIASAGGGT